MPTRTAHTAWTGGLQDGSGQVELSSSKVGTFDVSFPKRTADDAGGTTSPEELIAAAHSSCYAMQLSAAGSGSRRYAEELRHHRKCLARTRSGRRFSAHRYRADGAG